MRQYLLLRALGALVGLLLGILFIARIGLQLSTQEYDPRIYRFAGMTSMPTFRTAVADTYFFEERSTGKYYSSTTYDRVGPYAGKAPENSVLVGIYTTLIQNEYVNHYICEDLTSREARYCDLKTASYRTDMPSLYVPEGYIVTSVFIVNDVTRLKPKLYVVYNLVSSDRYFLAQANDPHLTELSIERDKRIVGTANIVIARRYVRVILEDRNGALSEIFLSD